MSAENMCTHQCMIEYRLIYSHIWTNYVKTNVQKYICDAISKMKRTELELRYLRQGRVPRRDHCLSVPEVEAKFSKYDEEML